MLTLALSIIADVHFVGPSVHDLVQLVAAFAPSTAVSFVLGVIVALVCPRCPEWPYAVSAIVGLLCHHTVLWWEADPNVWTWRDPITSEVYQFMPAVLFCAAPALLGTLIVRRLLSWRYAKNI